MKFVLSMRFLAGCLPLLALAPAAGLRAASGELDPAFSPKPGITAQVAEISGGKILALGDYTGGADGSEISLVRLGANGGVDPSFAAPYREFGQDRHFRVAPDGKIIVVGGILAGQSTNHPVTRLLSSGALDPGFSAAPAAVYATDLRVQTDGKVITNGQATVDASFSSALIRLNADGSIDRSYDTPASLLSSVPTDLALQPDGKLVLVGAFSDYNGSAFTNSAVTRLGTNAGYDADFQRAVAADPASEILTAVAIQPDGKIVVSGGKYEPAFQNTVSYVRRFSAGGTREGGYEAVFSLDPNVSPGGASVRRILAQRNGKIVVAGKFDKVNGAARVNVARLNADGSVDETFVSPAQFSDVIQTQVIDLAEQADGKLLVGGLLYSEKADPTSSATTVYGLVRLLNDDEGGVVVDPPPTGEKLLDLSATLAGAKLKLNKKGKPVLKATLTVNNGGKKAAKTVTAAAYLSADEKFDVAQDTYLQAIDLEAFGFKKLPKNGSTGPLALKFKPAGAPEEISGKYLLLVVDVAGSVEESDEANNVAVAGPL